MEMSDLLWALGGFTVGLVLWAIWGSRAASRTKELEADQDRLQRKLRQANATIETRDAEIAVLGAQVTSIDTGDIGVGVGVADFGAPAIDLDADLPIAEPSERLESGASTLSASALLAEESRDSDLVAEESHDFVVAEAAGRGRTIDADVVELAELDEVADQAVARARHLNEMLAQATQRVEAGDARIAMLEAAIVRADERLQARDASLATLTDELELARAEPVVDPERIGALEAELLTCRTARAEAAELNTLLVGERDQLAEALEATERQLRVTTNELAERELASVETRRQLAVIRSRLSGIVDGDGVIDLRDFTLAD